MVTGMKKEGKKYVKNYSAKPPEYPSIVNSKKLYEILMIYRGWRKYEFNGLLGCK
jgi:hypothetical protein